MIDTAAAMLTFFIAYFKLIVLFCLVASIIAMAEATPASPRQLASRISKLAVSLRSRFDAAVLNGAQIGDLR
jgi:hypothetical protein